jgi:hypothetical protein
VVTSLQDHGEAPVVADAGDGIVSSHEGGRRRSISHSCFKYALGYLDASATEGCSLTRHNNQRSEGSKSGRAHSTKGERRLEVHRAVDNMNARQRSPSVHARPQKGCGTEYRGGTEAGQQPSCPSVLVDLRRPAPLWMWPPSARRLQSGHGRGGAKPCLRPAPTWLRPQSVRCLKPRHGRGPVQLPSSSHKHCTSVKPRHGRGPAQLPSSSHKHCTSADDDVRGEYGRPWPRSGATSELLTRPMHQRRRADGRAASQTPPQ